MHPMEPTILPFLGTEVMFPAASVVGIVFALAQWMLVCQIKLDPGKSGSSKDGVSDFLIGEEEGLNDHNVVVKCAEIQSAISEDENREVYDFGRRFGATSFLFTEYQYVGIFMVAFAVLIFLFLGSVEGFSTKSQPCTYSKEKYCKAFLLGAITSLVSGFLGMKIATYTNARTSLEARKGVEKAFITAFRSGAAMGFFACSKWLVGPLHCNQLI